MVLSDGLTALPSRRPTSPRRSRGQIALPLDIRTETQVYLCLVSPGRAFREATVSLRPGVAHDLAQIFSGATS